MRIFWYLDVFPGRIAPGEGPDGGTGSGPREGVGGGAEAEVEGDVSSTPRPSLLPCRRVILGEG